MNKKKKGFTLAELLVVVAILSALVAIALPLFLKQKYEANLKADQTYVKSAKAEAVAEYLAGDEDEDTGSGIDYVFDGGLSMAFRTNSEASNDIKGYGRSTKDPYNTQTGVTDNSLPVQDGTSNFLKVHVKDGKATNVCWVNDKTTSCGDSGSTDQPDITPTPTPTTTPSDKEIITIGVVDITVAGSWPIKEIDFPQVDSPERIMKPGQVYTYEGKLFVNTDTNNITFNYYNCPTPYEAYYAVEITGANINNYYDENTIQSRLPNLQRGDIYVSPDRNVYIRLVSAPGTLGDLDSGNWKKILSYCN